MTEARTLDASFCPICGVRVATAEAVATAEPLAAQGVYERSGAHLVIEGTLVSVYEHDGTANEDGGR